MKSKPALLFILLLFSCIYDPPQKGKEILIHNQSDKPIIILDALTGGYLKLYDTGIVNNRIFISREPNYVADYGVYQKFYSDSELDFLKRKNNSGIILYIVDTLNVENNLNGSPGNGSFRSFIINIDTLKKYQLNHLFITADTILFEHNYDYYTSRKL